METRAGDPGAFARFDLARVDSPAFVVDAARVRQETQEEQRVLLETTLREIEQESRARNDARR